MSYLVNSKGQIEFGYTKAKEINHLDYDLRNAMDKPLSHWRKKFKFNQFQFISIKCDDFIMGMAIVDLKYASNCFVYLYHIEKQTFEEFDFIQPFSLKTRMSSHPNKGFSSISKADNFLQFEAKHQARHITLRLKNGLSLEAIIDETNSDKALNLCSKAGYNGWVYTQKLTARPVHGQLNWQSKSYPLEARRALASIDWSAGFMRRETSWHWASLSTYLEDGRRLGFNLASGVNETGFSENAIWLDDEYYKIDMVDFSFDRYQESQTWHLISNDAKLELSFEKQGKRAQKMNLILIASNFRQFFGYFNGSIKLNKETIKIQNAMGLVEDHYAKW